MIPEDLTISEWTIKTFMDAMIRLGLIVLLAILCFLIFSPFLGILLWGLIIAIVLYPLHQRLAKWFKGRQGRASIMIVVSGFVLLVVPLGLLSGSFVTHIHDVHTGLQKNTLTIKQPGPGVANWPVIGKKVSKAWSQAASNLPKFLNEYKEDVQKISKYILRLAESGFKSVFLFLGALVIAGIMMAWGKPGSNAMLSILSRVVGPDKGYQLRRLSVGTVRSVAAGVLGVAFIQALLFGIGFILVGIPAAGLLALIVLVIGIVQLPAVIVALPVLIYVWTAGDASTISNILYTIYFVAAGLSDNILKPLLLGRGVDAPMPVILIGALGGMVTGGFIGLFLGAILLAMGFQIFMDWIDNNQVDTDESDVPIPGAKTT